MYEVLSDAEVMKYIEPVFDMEKTTDFIKNAGLCEPPLVYAVEILETERVIGHLIFHSYEKNDYVNAINLWKQALNYDINIDYGNIIVENVHLGDSLLTLSYGVNNLLSEE